MKFETILEEAGAGIIAGGGTLFLVGIERPGDCVAIGIGIASLAVGAVIETARNRNTGSECDTIPAEDLAVQH